jgi:glucose-1-phosphatase
MNNIDNIIFDLGGVIMDIDVRKTQQAFREMGVKDIDRYFGHGFAASFFKEHEMGTISDEHFVREIRSLVQMDLPEEEIIRAWNALLLSFPPERITLLKAISKKYRIFLFSNTNAIHHQQFQQIFRNAFPGEQFDDHFEKAYYSHVLGKRKPDMPAFQSVIHESGLDPGRTLFVDDALVNVEGAVRAGLLGLYLPAGMSIVDIKW